VLLAFYFLKSLFHTSSKQTCLAMCHTLRLSGSSNGSTSWHQHQHYSFSFFCKVKKKCSKLTLEKWPGETPEGWEMKKGQLLPTF
jgi:hypothetical protein